MRHWHTLATAGIMLLVVAPAVAGGGPPARAQSPLELQPCPFVGTFCATLTIVAGSIAPPYALGNGRVTTSPSGIDCMLTARTGNGTCSHTFSWSRPAGPRFIVDLTMEAAPG